MKTDYESYADALKTTQQQHRSTLLKALAGGELGTFELNERLEKLSPNIIVGCYSGKNNE